VRYDHNVMNKPTIASRIIAHRGLWKTAPNFSGAAMNSKQAVRSAFELGFGVEIDIRDSGGEVVVSHDPDFGNTAPRLRDLLNVQARSKGTNGSILALNVKSDGLAQLNLRQILRDQGANYFLFDSSFPESIILRREGLRVAARVSDLEDLRPSEGASEMLWADDFEGDQPAFVERVHQLLDRGFKVCAVSPELHGRDNTFTWKCFIERFAQEERLLICTDEPIQFLEKATNGN
jgi:hypothetical protein